MTINTISTLPTAPARTDAPATFISRADAFLAALVVMQGELNTSIGQMNTDIAGVNANAISAAADAASASADAISAGTSETNAQIYAAAAQAAAGVPSLAGNALKKLSVNAAEDGVEWVEVQSDPTLGTLTKTFTPSESSTISLTSSVLAPVVSVTKEIPQTGVTNNSWDVNSTTENYTRIDSAYATTLSFTGGGSPFVLGTGSFASADVGKTIEANSGVFVLIATDGSFVETTAPTSYDQVASGSWSMYGVVYNATDGDLELSGITVGFDISSASYSQNFSIAAQEVSPQGVVFNTDGTKMFVVGSSGDDINEYTLSTAFDISTASFVDSFSVSSQDTSPQDVAFNNDGTKMFMCGIGSSSVHEYILSTGFDVSTASFVDSFSFSSQDTSPSGITFNSDGTKMFMIGDTNNSIYEYTLSTAFDISTSGYLQSFSVSAQEGQPKGISFSSDGKKMFIIGYGAVAVLEYSLTTQFDISTASFVQSFSVSSQESDPTGITFSSDGTKMFVIGLSGDDINEYSVGSVYILSGYHPVHTTASTNTTYWTDINSMTADQAAGDGNVYYAISTDDRTTWTVIDNTDGERDIVRNNAGTWQYNSNGTYALETWVNGATNTELATLAEAMEGAEGVENGFDVSTAASSATFSLTQDTRPNGITFNTEGTKMFIAGDELNAVYEYNLSTSFSVSTAVYSQSFSVAAQELNPTGIAFNSDGTKMYIIGEGSDRVYQYSLSTGFDISTASYDSVSFLVSSQDTAPTSLTFNTDGSKMFVTGNTNDSVYEYSLSTNFDISTASYTQAFSVAAQDTQPFDIKFNPSGTKMFVIGEQNRNVNEYSLSTAFNISTASYTQNFATGFAGTRGLAFNSNGSKMFVVNQTGLGDDLYEYTVGTATYTNQMDKTQLDAVTDPNHIALGDDLDLAIIFNMTSGSTVPSSDGVAINYDANVLNKGAVLGTDYDFDAPTQNSVRITALATNNLKVRVV